MNKSFNKLLITTTISGLLISNASAKSFKELNPYIGIDFQNTSYDYNSNYTDLGNSIDGNIVLEDSLNGINIHGGIRPFKNLGFEVGYFNNFEEDKNITNGQSVGNGTVAAADFTTSVKTQGITLDALAYLPVGKNKKFELIGTAGISYTNAEIKLDVVNAGSTTEDESEFGFRAGIGGQININDKFNLRAIGHYQTTDFENIVEDAMVYNVGFNYNF